MAFAAAFALSRLPPLVGSLLWTILNADELGTSLVKRCSAPVADYSFTLDGRDLADERVTTGQYADDSAAVLAAGLLLGDQVQSVSVAHGACEDLEWLGAWDWCDGQSRWTPDE